MNLAAARRTGAPSPSVRALSLLLAAMLTLLPLTMLLLGLSIRAISAWRTRDQPVEFIPLPLPTPAPPDRTPRPRPEHLAGPATPAPPAPAAPAPVAIVQVPASPAPAPAAPSPLDGSGTGNGGNGNGAGGSGRGEGGAPPPSFVPASWAVMPGNPEIAPFDPPRARVEHVSGQVLLSCRVLRTRRVADCRVLQEKPRGWGFGKAAIGASAGFQMNPPMRDGIVDEVSRIEIPVAFNDRSRTR